MGQVPEIKLMMIKHTGPVTLADDAWVRIVLWADEGRGPKRQSVGICGLATRKETMNTRAAHAMAGLARRTLLVLGPRP